MIGSIVLTLALAMSVFSMVMYFYTYRGAKNTLALARLSYHAMAMLVIIASTILLYFILTHQYQYKYVYSYSSSDLPLGYLIATFWAGQEGSFMLWLLLTAIIGIFLQSYASKMGDLEPRLMMIYALATSFLLVMVSPLLKSPFAYLWTDPVFVDVKNVSQAVFSIQALQGFFFSDPSNGTNFLKISSDILPVLSSLGISVNDVITQGKGLNPLLQNFWMQIHPPILFIGFAMGTVPFAFAMAALIKNDYRDWVRQSFPWVLGGAGVLGLGIMLGGYWAYGILGWGGYWAWDPVENSSLVPWLISVAAIHTMVVQRKDQGKDPNRIGRYAVTNLILSMSIYILVLYSTFLTRSGVLGDASVHSFVDPGMVVYLFLITLIGSFALMGAVMIAYRWKTLSAANAEANSEETLLSRELSLFTAAVAMTASAIIVFTGTSAPIFGQSVDIVFYDDMHIPLAIIIMFLNGMSLLLKWKATKGAELFKKLRWPAILSLAITAAVVIFGGVTNIMMILMTLSSAFALIVNGEIAYKIFTGKPKMAGAYIAHMGIALFILGVVGSAGHSIEKDIDLPKGETVEIFGHKLTFTGYNGIENNKKFAFNVDVTKGDEKYTISPVMYISDFNQGLMREPDILMGLTKDLYISPLGFDEGGADHAEGNEITLTVDEETRVQGLKIKYIDFVKPDMTAMMGGGDFVMGAKLSVEKDGQVFAMDALMRSTGGNVTFDVLEIPGTDLKIQLKKVDPATKKADFVVSGGSHDGHNHAAGEVLSVTASIKPYVNLVWLGVIVMTLGFFFSMFRRLDETVPSGSSDN